MTNYKNRCAELAQHLDDTLNFTISSETRKYLKALISTVRSELAEPEPEGPTDEEIMDLMPQQMRDDLAAAARAMSGFDPDNIKAASVSRIILNRHSVDHARAVLARWGNCSAPQPIPVSKRWPEPEEMAEEEEVWVECVGYDYPIADTGDYHWEPHMWILRPITQSDIGHNPRWLPAHALPVPSHD